MRKSNSLLRERMASHPMTEAERENSIRLVAQGESIADALISLARLFHRVPTLHHVSHSH